MKIEVIERQDEFFALEKDWNRLLEASENNNIFLTFEWLTCWWKAFGKGKRLFILLAKEGEEVIGIAPLMISREEKGFFGQRVLSFLGTRASAYGDFIIKRKRKEALGCFFNSLKDNASCWDIAEFRQVPEDSPNFVLLKQLAAASGLLVEERTSLSCCYIPLEGTWESYFAGFNYRNRQEFKRQARRLSEAGKISFVHYGGSGQQNAQEVLPFLFEVSGKRWNILKKSDPLRSCERQKFIEEVTQCFQKNHWLDLAVLKCDDRIIAYSLAFCYGRKYWGYNTAFDPAFAKFGPGAMIFKEVIEYAFKQNLSEFDMLQGEGLHKSKWAKQERRTFELLIFKRTLVVLLFYMWMVKVKPWMRKSRLLKKIKDVLEHGQYYARRLNAKKHQFPAGEDRDAAV